MEIVEADVVYRLQEPSRYSLKRLFHKKSSAGLSTSIPKAHLPFENVTAKLSNRLAFNGYFLDCLKCGCQNIGCFALIEAERPGHSAAVLIRNFSLGRSVSEFIAYIELPEGGRE